MCIHCLGHLSPTPASRQNLLCLLLQFFWRGNIKANKKDTAFLLAWAKDSYTERLLALLPCTCVLQPELVHLYMTSSLPPSHLPVVACRFKITIFTLLQWAHQTLSSFGFLLFPYSSFMCLPLNMWPCPIILCQLF
jgi:hypothetical protein